MPIRGQRRSASPDLRLSTLWGVTLGRAVADGRSDRGCRPVVARRLGLALLVPRLSDVFADLLSKRLACDERRQKRVVCFTREQSCLHQQRERNNQSECPPWTARQR